MIPETNRRPGVCTAFSDAGLELPVIDVTHPAFAFEPSAAELEAVTAASLQGLERARLVPAFVHRLMARRSILMRGTLAAAGRPLDSMTTYLLKLGPENLGPGYASDLDRELAGTVGAVATRLRLRDGARLLAAGLAPLLASAPDAPLHLIDIAGGTAIGALNALLLLHRATPDPLAGRDVCIHLLDLDAEGPHFAARALAAWSAPGAPLDGVAATLQHLPYDWRLPAVLREHLRTTVPDAALLVACSEGGLFEYGSDADIAANLEVLRASRPAVCFVAGSTMREVPMAQAIHAASRMPLRFFTRHAFGGLVASAGWKVAAVVDGNPLYDVCRLLPR